MATKMLSQKSDFLAAYKTKVNFSVNCQWLNLTKYVGVNPREMLDVITETIKLKLRQQTVDMSLVSIVLCEREDIVSTLEHITLCLVPL